MLTVGDCRPAHRLFAARMVAAMQTLIDALKSSPAGESKAKSAAPPDALLFRIHDYLKVQRVLYLQL